MTERITPEELSPEAIDPESEANESRKARAEVRDDDRRGVTGLVENAFSTLISPLAQDRPSEGDVEERREENDREQRA